MNERLNTCFSLIPVEKGGVSMMKPAGGSKMKITSCEQSRLKKKSAFSPALWPSANKLSNPMVKVMPAANIAVIWLKDSISYLMQLDK